MTPFEAWLKAKKIDVKLLTTEERIKLGQDFIAELKAKRATTDKIVNK